MPTGKGDAKNQTLQDGFRRRIEARIRYHGSPAERFDLSFCSYCDIDSGTAEWLVSRLGTLAGLRTLDISGNEIGDAGAAALADATHLSGLRTLNISRNGIREAGAVAFTATSHHFSQLHTLDISYNLIGAAGAESLANATHLGRLHTLNISDNEIGDAGIASLAAATHLSRLNTLDVGYNRIENPQLVIRLCDGLLARDQAASNDEGVEAKPSKRPAYEGFGSSRRRSRPTRFVPRDRRP